MTLRTNDVDGVEMIILPPVRDLGDGFRVWRALPSAHRRMVGPFIFFDHMGPATFGAGQGFDVRPHPHIGLSTVTYLIDGEVTHRDNIGVVQTIRPGDVNWMTAGSGIVHSERTPPQERAEGGDLFGIQAWVALPTQEEEVAPSFAHHASAEIPTTEAEGVCLTVIAGETDGLKSPVKTHSDMVYADVILTNGGTYHIRPTFEDRAIYVLSGDLEVAGQTGSFGQGELVILKPGAEVVVSARRNHSARLMLMGGEPFPEQRHIYWNFVSSSADRIEQAKRDWRERRFPGVPGEHEFIPLPDDMPRI
jgi:redox-sensitive bicupin YhaK (pirin superfamily)